MDLRNLALVSAGIIGCVVAVVHGILVQRLMVMPFDEFARTGGRISPPIRRLVPLLLHFSTVSWFVGGLALIAAANWLERDVKLATALFVGGLYLFGALGNFWGTHGRHPGWMMLAIALALIAFGISKPPI